MKLLIKKNPYDVYIEQFGILISNTSYGEEQLKAVAIAAKDASAGIMRCKSEVLNLLENGGQV